MQTKENHDDLNDFLNEPIAIVGVNCQFPGVGQDIEDIDAFYKTLLNEQTPIKEVPKNRWDINQYYDADRQKENKIVSRVGGFMEDPQLFDAAFFKISPTEAKQIDPQHRLFLEVSIRALNHANITLDSLRDSNTGVYCGISTDDYGQLNYKDHIHFNAYTYIGSTNSAAAGRLSYFLNLKGPCVTVDTACSSSLSAIFVAATALRNRQCNMAIVGGVHLSLCPEIMIGLTKANMLSALGQCSSFDAKADGYVRSEGCAVVVVKRLSDAIKDKNTIHAVIKSIIMNQDGGGMGMAAPNVEAQIAMHQSALKEANLTPTDIDYIETHGTGTVVGDSVEFNAIQKVHQGQHSQDKPLVIGALKSNLGHTISASGIASIIKVITAFKHETIPANLHFSTPNDSISPESIPALIPVKATTFIKGHNKKRYAQVSNFGFTGTNVSAIIEEPPETVFNESRAEVSKPVCFVISANSEDSLKRMLATHIHYLKKSSVNLQDVCHTLINCRDHYKFRCAIIAKDKENLIKKIETQNYELKKITPEKNERKIGEDAEEIHAAYLAGGNIRSKNMSYNSADIPLYVFDRKRYWHDKEEPCSIPIATVVPTDWSFVLEWQSLSIHLNNQKKSGKHWLLVGAKALAADFTNVGLDIVLEADNVSFQDLDGVIFAPGFESPLLKNNYARIDFQKDILKKLLTLVKELNHKAIELPLIILTSNSIAELAEKEINLSSSALPGFCKTLVLEVPQHQTILIDFDKTTTKNVISHVLNEINYNHGHYYEHVVAYRGGKRLVSRLKRTVIPLEKPILHHEARYLITGGCGGLGLITAKALLAQGVNELILVSRTIDKPSFLKNLEKIRSQYPDKIIRPVSLDMANKESIRRLLLDINADGLLKGIVHAAGAGFNASVLHHQDEDIDYLFAAKAKGGWYLHELSQDFDLDFFVVYSSISSVFGSNKESVYSASNTFLDALIAERRRLGLVGNAIQWGPWAEVGMAEKRSRDPGLKQALIHNDQGQAWIQILIHGQSPHTTIISPEYLLFMLDFVPKPLPAFYKNLADDLTLSAPVPTNHLPQWINDYFKLDNSKKFTACKDMLTATCKDVLGISAAEDLDDDEGFFQIGLDSLMITELASKLKAMLASCFTVSATVAFDYPSINKLAHYIESALNSHFINIQESSLSAEPTDESIAIIGMSCSLPNAPDITAFEVLLENGMSGIKDIPIERWDNTQYYDADENAPGKSYIQKLGLIENIRSFDPQFFGISPREAPFLDPQQRLFLENCYKALENANYPTQTLRGSLTGVFAGVATSDYHLQLEKEGLTPDEMGMFAITGQSLNIIPARVAYTFDFKGPAVSIDTACSSSLVAIHQACQSLKNREIDFALAGGVNVILRPEGIVNLCKAKALSPESQCKTFDEKANGYARSEGCGVLFLKRVADALRNNDTILAVIKGSALNNDGKSAGLTVPNGKSQEAVMTSALKQTDLASTDIGYLEAHGTGTPLGDPIEMHAINKVYGSQRGKNNRLYVGAVKTNIGHLESAAGVASIIKVTLSLQKHKIYKNLNFQRLNPHIILGDTQIALQTTPWSSSKLRCAGVNAFGFSGTNAHVILQESPSPVLQKESHPLQANVLVLSAKTQSALDNLADSYKEFLKETTHDFMDVCFTAATGRDHYPLRLAVTAKTTIEASQLLEKGEYINDSTLDAIQNAELKLLVTDYLSGMQVDWRSYYIASKQQLLKVTLPNYPFSRSEFWLAKGGEKKVSQGHSHHPLVGAMISLPGKEYLFNHQLQLRNLNYINQHHIFEKVMVPTAVFIESGLAAAKAILGRGVVCIEQFKIERPLHPAAVQEIQLHAKPKDGEQYQVTIFAKQDEDWQKIVEMQLRTTELVPESIHVHDLKSAFNQSVDLAQFYINLNNGSHFYGDEFHAFQEAYVAVDKVLTKLTMTQSNSEPSYCDHPVSIENAIQSLSLMMDSVDPGASYLPYAFTSMVMFQEASRTVWIYAIKCAAEHENEFCAHVKFYDNSGLLLGQIQELRLRKVTLNDFVSYEVALHHLYEMAWNKLDTYTEGSNVPDFWVISKNECRTKKVFAHLNYQRVENVKTLESIENKHIVFLYEQEQFQALFHCCQFLFKSNPASFVLVTENAYAINATGVETVNPYHTMASAFWKSFRNELELNRNYTIDLNSEATLQEILKYLFNKASAETQYAVRDSIYVPRLKKKQRSVCSHQQLFDSEASYLITGGTGGLANPLIEYLIGRGVKHIIITSRSQASSATRDLIESASKKQVKIEHYAAEASNLQQMQHVIKAAEKNVKPLKGVFHLAGVIQDDLIVKLTDEQVQQVLTAKMESARILHELTKNLQLDMFVLFSSAASILGSRGQSNYVASNGFLDGLAYLRHQQGLPALTINWGAFHSIGMAARHMASIQRRGMIAMGKESINVLDNLLPSKLPQIIVCPINWDIYLKSTPYQMVLSEQGKSRTSSAQFFLTCLRQQPEKERIALLTQALCEITADVLKLDNIEDMGTKDLFAMGMDSLTSLELRNRIHDKLQCPTLSLPIEYFINDPRIDRIAKNIAKELNEFCVHTRDDFSAENSTLEAVPLCDSQYVFWMITKLGSSFNCAGQLRFHGNLNKEYLQQAFEFAVNQNNVFWLNISDKAPLQRLNREGEFNLIYEDISLNFTQESLNEKFYSNLWAQIPFTVQPLIRVYLYKLNHDLHEVHIFIPHIILDEPSYRIFFNQFKSKYEALVRGADMVTTVQEHTYLDYVKQRNAHYEKDIQNKIAFWPVYNKGFKRLRLGRAHHLVDAAEQEQYLFHYTLNAECVEKFRDWHHKKNLNVSTGLLAACQVAFYKLGSDKKVPIVILHSGKEGSRYQSVIGVFSESKRINITLNETDTFTELLQSIDGQLLKTAPFQKCSLFIKNLSLDGNRFSIGRYATYLYYRYVLTEEFKKCNLNPLTMDYYIKYFSSMKWVRVKIWLRAKVMSLFKLKLSLLKLSRMRVLINITSSFFIKETRDLNFAGVQASIPYNYGTLERPIGNQGLLLYFSRTPDGEYILSINGPLTDNSKERLAQEFNRIMAKVMENDDYIVTDLI